MPIHPFLPSRSFHFLPSLSTLTHSSTCLPTLHSLSTFTFTPFSFSSPSHPSIPPPSTPHKPSIPPPTHSHTHSLTHPPFHTFFPTLKRLLSFTLSFSLASLAQPCTSSSCVRFHSRPSPYTNVLSPLPPAPPFLPLPSPFLCHPFSWEWLERACNRVF